MITAVRGALASTLFCSVLLTSTARAEVNVCVEVVKNERALRTRPARPPAEEPSEGPSSQPHRTMVRVKNPPISPQHHDASMTPLGQTSTGYLQRLIEYFVTHQPGHQAVGEGCTYRLRVELYPLRNGWTVFARYSRFNREEWVDQLFPDELSQFAERAVLALLYNKPISSTIQRDTVLRSDTRPPKRWIRGTHHFALQLGTQLRGGALPTVQDDGSLATKARLFSPMTLGLGYRGKFENWGIESMAHLAIGTSKTALSRNPGGGHVDLGGNLAAALHFLRYLNPRGVTSSFIGAGGTFELMWFSVIQNQQLNPYGDSQRSSLFTGGVDVDLVYGWEFMRATSVHWVIQGELHLPAYLVDSENDDGGVHSWMPGLSIRLGVLF